MCSCLGFKVWGLASKVQGLEFKVWGFKVWGLRFWVLRFWVLRFGVSGLRVWIFGATG